jgi:hypothetical protein
MGLRLEWVKKTNAWPPAPTATASQYLDIILDHTWALSGSFLPPCQRVSRDDLSQGNGDRVRKLGASLVVAFD